MIEDFHHIAFIQRAKRLPGFVVVDQHQLQAGRAQGIALAADAQIAALLVDHPEFIPFFAQNARQQIPDAGGALKLRHFGVAGLAARVRKQIRYEHVGMAVVDAHRTPHEGEEAHDGDQAKGSAIRVDNGRHATRAVGNRPRFVQRRIGGGGVEALGNGAEAGGGILQKHGRFAANALENPRCLRVKLAGARRHHSPIVDLLIQQPRIANCGANGVGVRVQMADDKECIGWIAHEFVLVVARLLAAGSLESVTVTSSTAAVSSPIGATNEAVSMGTVGSGPKGLTKAWVSPRSVTRAGEAPTILASARSQESASMPYDSS
jgi:hypothetical protein